MGGPRAKLCTLVTCLFLRVASAIEAPRRGSYSVGSSSCDAEQDRTTLLQKKVLTANMDVATAKCATTTAVEKCMENTLMKFETPYDIVAVIGKCVGNIWAAYDKDNSGSLDKEETKTFGQEALSEMNDEFPDFDQCFKEFDTDGSDTIEEREMADFMEKEEAKKGKKEEKKEYKEEGKDNADTEEKKEKKEYKKKGKDKADTEEKEEKKEYKEKGKDKTKKGKKEEKKEYKEKGKDKTNKGEKEEQTEYEKNAVTRKMREKKEAD